MGTTRRFNPAVDLYCLLEDTVVVPLRGSTSYNESNDATQCAFVRVMPWRLAYIVADVLRRSFR